MKTETKSNIFFLLTLGLSITFAVLTIMGIANLFGREVPFDPMEDFLGVFILTGVFFAPIAHIVNAVFDFFGIWTDEDSTNGNAKN